jgi:HD-like signal output (HDOD) protein/DNA-binding NarL/FixJ family response regulator
MRTSRDYRALVVDDEIALQKLLMLALSRQGFLCDSAGDGAEAEQLVAETAYDLVVTDLRMPNKHGYALATHLLTLNRRPVIMVLTSVIEPRLAKDLLARGVDDILFKPTDFSFLATKAKAMVDRRYDVMPHGIDPNAKQEASQLQELPFTGEPVTLSQLESKLGGLSRILPISKAGLDVYKMTSTDEWEAPQIAAAIQRDPTITAEVLRLANSSFYNPSGQQIMKLERAVVTIGQRRIGELALATNALTALTSGIVPWMDIGLAWKKSMAAGLAADVFIDQGGYKEVEEGLVLSSLMHSLGRIVLGTLFPKQYDAMIRRCELHGDALQEQERQMFPMSHTGVVGHLLETWNIPADVHLPLKYALDDYASLCRVSEPVRTKAELVKLSIFVGYLAAGKWEPWDLIELPPVSVTRRLGITSLSEIVEQTTGDVELLATFSTDPPAAKIENTVPPLRELAYCDLSNSTCDFLGKIINSMRIRVARCAEEELEAQCGNVLVNCVGVPPQHLAPFRGQSAAERLFLVVDADQIDAFEEFGHVIGLPTSYRRLYAICWDAARTIVPRKKFAGTAFSSLA